MTAGAENWRVYGIAGPKKALPVEKSGKSPKYYPADDIKRPKPSRKNVHKPARVRQSITPGSILILLAGRFRGKRVVCLKALPSGLLLVSGPYSLNGVPIRRVNQAYVIATSTKIDVSSIDVSTISDEYFKRSKSTKGEGEDEFFLGDAPQPAIVSEERKKDQKVVDEALLKVVEQTPNLKRYLKARFSLTGNDLPHKMKF
jgi:large subunit ribosomal protein L6e